MANRVRGVRQKLPPNSILTSGPGMAGSLVPARATSLASVLNNMIQSGALPLPGSGLPSISSGDILSNITGSSAQPIGNTLSATLDFVFGMAEGSILQRGASTWQVLTPGTAGYVLTSQGSGALLDWAAASVSFTYSGAWSGASAYSPGDVVTYSGSAYLCYSAVSAPSGGAIALDGSAGTTVGNGHSTKTVTLSTTKTNDVICVIVTAEDNTIGTVTSTVSSISDTAGLSWTKRTGQQGRNTSGGSGNDTSTIELWYAVSSAILTSDVITVNFAASVDGGCIIAFGVNNAKTAAPFDVNASLPDFATTGLSVTISTTGSADMVVFVNTRAGFSGTAPTAPGGFTQITGGEFDNSGLSNSGLNVFYKITSAPLSGSTITSGITGTYYPNMLADAFLQGTALNPAPSTDDLHWLSQGAAGVPLITAVDSNFTVNSGTLEFATIASGDVIGNSGASTAEPTAATMTAMIDRAFGSTEGQLLQRGSSAWQILPPGSAGQVLLSGGASALNSWGTDELGVATNSNAPAGYKGQVIYGNTSSSSGVAMASNTDTVIASVLLTAGDWDVDASLFFDGSVGSTLIEFAAVITTGTSRPSFTFNTVPLGYTFMSGISIPGGQPVIDTLNTVQFLLASTTTINLVGYVNYSGSGATYNGGGILFARRAR